MRETDRRIPEGRDFLRLMWAQEDECQATTDREIENLGKKAPECLEYIGSVLSLLDRMASCWWRCNGGNHRIERLCGKASANARSSLRLMRFGFYDESLVHCRIVGEIANLLNLFAVDNDAYRTWSASSEHESKHAFAPVRVRERLEKIQGSPLIDKTRYGLLSGYAVHPQPHTNPNSFNRLGIPTIGGYMQQEGVLICINELLLPLCVAAAFAARSLELDDTVRNRVVRITRAGIASLGGLTLDSRCRD